MITPTQMYWLVTLDSIIGAGVILALICVVASFFTLGWRIIDGGPLWAPIASVTAFLLSIAIVTFTPSTKQMAAIIIVPRIANSEKVQTVGNHLYDLAVEWMNELRPNKKREK